MTWVRRDDQASIHRKVAPLDDATYRLWSEAMEWCSRNGTDGLIAADELQDASKRGTPPRAGTLVRRRLWHEAGDECGSDKCPPPSDVAGWRIHDYLDYNPSRADVVADLRAKADRQKRWRDKRNGRYVDASHDGPHDASVTGYETPPRPVPSRPAPKEAGAGPLPSGSPPHGSAARPGDEPKSTTAAAVKCPRCMNALESRYHLQVCLPSEEAPDAG